MRVAFVNSGLGLLPAAVALRRSVPDADVVLSMDPDGMPWGPRPVPDIIRRTLDCCRAAAELSPDALVLACNTASVHALDAVRARFEPDLPVVGTVPAIKTATSSGGGRVAIWATVATTGSAYQRRLIESFAAGSTVTAVACPGLADAVDAGDPVATAAAITAAAGRTPTDVTDVVLGCTEYELVPDLIAAALADAGTRGVTLHGSAGAIALQTLRRLQRRAGGVGVGGGRLDVLLSGRPAGLPPAAWRYPAGRELTGRGEPVASIG